MAASPKVVGVRLATSEYGDTYYDGKAETSWYDVTTGDVRDVADLFVPDVAGTLMPRIVEAAEQDPRVVKEELFAQLDGDLEAFDSVAFTTDGRLWVEFDRQQISDNPEPIGVAIDPSGLLSAFGQAAQAAAMTPSDPQIAPAQTETATEEPPATQTDEPQSSPSRTPRATSRPLPSGSVDCRTAKCVALTFDDGPVQQTADLLDVFAAKGVRATFFVVGKNVKAHPELIKRMVAEGHVVGNHTYDHPQLTRLSEAAIRKELQTTNALVADASGVTPDLLRPPYGATNSGVASVAAGLGMSQIVWSVDPLDWKDRNSATVTSRVLAAAKPGAIILSHDIHATTRAAYAGIVDALQAKGYVLVTVPELLGGRYEPGKKYSQRSSS